MIMNSKKKYIAPTLRVSSYQAEKGYAVSLWFVQNVLDQEGYDDNNQEIWNWTTEGGDDANHFGGSGAWTNDGWD